MAETTVERLRSAHVEQDCLLITVEERAALLAVVEAAQEVADAYEHIGVRVGAPRLRKLSTALAALAAPAPDKEPDG